jgi:DNA invertase Pin-like site-specific DNA recombinase
MQEGLTITEEQIYQDLNVSAGRAWGERPQGRVLLAADGKTGAFTKLKAGDVVIVSKMDRVFRSAQEALNMAATFRERKIRLVLLDMGGDVTGNGGNAAATMFFTMMAAISEFERDRITERIRESKAIAAERGQYLGGAAPFGWTKDRAGALVEAPQQRRALRRVVELHQRHEWSLRKIAAAVKRELGQSMSPTLVQKTIQRAAKKGRR